MKKRFSGDLEKKQALKLVRRLLADMREGWIVVEGQKDRNALKALDCNNVLTVSGNLIITSKKLSEESVEKVIVLTDLDSRGDELLVETREELERYGISVDDNIRKQISGVLNVKYFENIEKKYKEFMKEIGDING